MDGRAGFDGSAGNKGKVTFIQSPAPPPAQSPASN
jgi:hypothetical protein